MRFSDKEISELCESICHRLSEGRLRHTLAVRDTALLLADYFLPNMKDVVEASALLHDVSKEIPIEEQIDMLLESGDIASRSEIPEYGVIHSLTAPLVVKRDYHRFAIDEVLSAVYNHTTGSPDMTVLDEIIFLADFIEETRTHNSCRSLRERVLSGLKRGADAENLSLLHEACVFEIDSTISYLISNKKKIDVKAILTRNVLLSKI